uniref:Transposon TX1 uncharacterized n=1 Tax=Cajanus cajan TaxID=3821 RepID=A0A151QYX4_CAJCA|nr:Transposon TX1 uncharacterized [Cajanus cajan]
MEEDIHFLCLQETKKQDVTNEICCSLWGDNDCDWRMVPAINMAGGLLTTWRKDKFDLVNQFEGLGFLGIVGTWKDNGAQIVVVNNVYAPCQSMLKRELWAELIGKRSAISVSLWCVAGDFNSIRAVSERVNLVRESNNQTDIQLFNDFISNMEVEDISIVGKRFTWFKPNGMVKSRLDRILVSREWFLIWPGCLQTVLNRYHWFQDPSFKKFVVDSWEGISIQGWGAYVLKEKLRVLKSKLKHWNLESFENPQALQQRIVKDLNYLDKKEENLGLSEEEIHKRVELQNEFWKVAIRNEAVLSQQSRVKWLKEGDLNTKFFHLMVSWRRKKNALKGLFIDGSWSEDPTVVKGHVRDFFYQRLNELLIAPFSEEEIRSAVWECGSNKCPGLDGVNFKFLKEFWETLRGDMCRFLTEFHHNGRLPRGTNSAFITLIPKKQDPQRLEDYKPISLVGCMYKILAKVLANRVKQVLPSVIDERRQSALLEGRNMLYSVLVVNEVIDEAKRMKKPIIFFKVDFEKAHDSVSWEYLLYMLERLGFNPKWIGWIRECLNIARLSVLVNGSPTSEFPMGRGLRQGDPLAPSSS